MRLNGLIALVIVCSANAKNYTEEKISTKDMLSELKLENCVNSDSIVTCLASKVASTIEQSMDKNVPLFEDFTFLRNTEKINIRRPKSLDGIDRFLRAISDFIDTHSFSVDLTNITARSLDVDEKNLAKRGGGAGGGGGGGGGGGMLGMGMKGMKKEKGYYQYAFMVLLGIFGLTGPLVMKILGIMAAKSLLAAKAALLIVGSVALKKLFEKGHQEKPKIKVTTLPIHEEDDEHDRISYSFNHIPYGYVPYGYSHLNNRPYSAYYSGNSISDNNEFAPVMYDKKTNS